MFPLLSRHFPKIGWSICAIVALFLLWQIAASLQWIPSIFLPSPRSVLGSLWALVESGRFISALVISFGRIFFATLLSIVIGGTVGVMTGYSPSMEYVLLPITQPMRYVPLTAILPLLILWFGIGEWMKISFLVIAIVSYVIPIVQQAVATVPPEFLAVAKSFGAHVPSLVRYVFIPHALPRILDGLIVVNALGWNYVVLAEIINAKDGLGYLLYIAGRLQRSDEVLAGLILISLVAMTTEFALRSVRRKFFFW